MRLLDDAEFRATHVWSHLQTHPLGFVDVGARGGVPAYMEPLAEAAGVLAFEPDPSSIADLSALLGTRWAVRRVENTAVGGSCGQAVLHLYAHGVNHSLLQVNSDFRDRYRVSSLADRGQVPVNVETLDSVVFGRCADEPFWGEVLKLDAQGAELDILRGAARTLDKRTVALVVECCFVDIYRSQPRFCDLQHFLATKGFTFYGFLSLQGWSQKHIEKANALGRERLCFGDAIFLKDPLAATEWRGAMLTPRQWAILYVSCLLLGYADFAIELACEANLPIEEAERLISVARRSVEHPASEAIAEVEALLSRMRAQPERAAIELGRFADSRRTLFDMSDAALSRVRPIPRAARP